MNSCPCVVGIGTIEVEDSISTMSHKEMLFYATKKALNDAGLERKDIGSAFTSVL